MAVAIHNKACSSTFSNTSSTRSMRARPTHIRQVTALTPAPRMFTGSLVQNPLLHPQHLQQQQQRGIVCQGLFGLGLPEIAVIAGVAALVFGPSKLPELGKGLGKTVKSFQTAAKEFKTELEAAANAEEEPAAAAAAKQPQEGEKTASKSE